MDITNFSGLIVPTTTPFNKEMEIDEKAYADHLEFLEANGVTRLLVNGTTAEFFSLLPEERKFLLTMTRKYFSGMLLFNTASDSLHQAKKAAGWAEDYGANAIVAMTPYYFADAPEEGVISFFNELGSSVKIPMILYNFHQHTNNPITSEILKAVRHIALKDSSGDHLLIKHTPCYFAGTSRKMVEGHLAGAKGFVSSLANLVPELYVKLEAALKGDNIETAKSIQDEIIRNCADISADSEISAIKAKLSKIIKGYPPDVRLPLSAL